MTDPDLVQFLIGTHHGAGRPFFPLCQDERPPDVDFPWKNQDWQLTGERRSEQELYRIESDWPSLLSRLTARYGVWGLAWLEAVFRLADHSQSALEREPDASKSETVANA